MRNIDISVLLCTYNRAHFLEEILTRLTGQELMGTQSLEIVVVDNGSTDNSEAVIREIAGDSEIPIRYVYEPIKGVHQARNRSLREGKGRWFAFLDDDEIPDERWLIELYDAARQTGASVLGGSVRLLLSEDKLESLGSETRASLRERTEVRFGQQIAPFRRGSYPGTDNLFMNRDVIDAIGDFDEKMTMGGADHDLIIRAINAGFPAWYVPRAVVFHRVPPVRLTPEFLKNDAFQSGWMLALLRHRYDGWSKLLVEMIARVGQAAIVTLPLMAKAAVVNDDAELLDRHIKLWRANAFVRYTVMLAFPWLPGNQSFVRGLDFRRARSITTRKPKPQSDGKQDH